MENGAATSSRVNKELPDEPAIPFLDMYPIELKTHVYKKYRTQMFMAALLIIVPKWIQHKCLSTDKWIF